MRTPILATDPYRLPWTLPNDAIRWLEPTSACTLYRDGCPDIMMRDNKLVWS